MSRHTLQVALGALLVGSVLASIGLAAAGSGFALTASPAVDVPTRTTTYDGTEYTISAVGRAHSGTSVTVDAAVRSGDRYYIHLYNADKQIVASKQATGNVTRTFRTDALDPGSYVLAIEQSGDVKTIHPLVVPAFDVSVSSPSSATRGDTVRVDASLSRVESGQTLDHVEVVVANADDDARVRMTDRGGGTYSANVSTDGLSAGAYRVYAVGRGTETVDGTKEMLAISDTQSLTLEPAATRTTTTRRTTDSGTGGTGDSGTGDTGDSAGGGGDPTPTTRATTPTTQDTTASPTTTTATTTAGHDTTSVTRRTATTARTTGPTTGGPIQPTSDFMSNATTVGTTASGPVDVGLLRAGTLAALAAVGWWLLAGRFRR